MSILKNSNDSTAILRIKPALLSEIKMPVDEDNAFLEFYEPEYENEGWLEDMNESNIKKLISPYQEYAFTEEVLHEVANQSLGFFLPQEMWSYIESAFAYYWDEEVGFNGVTCEDYMFLSIQQQLIDKNIFFPDELLSKVVTSIYDFMMEIPGVILDY